LTLTVKCFNSKPNGSSISPNRLIDCTDAIHPHRTQVYTEVMSDIQTVTIHLSSEERGLLVRHRSERASYRLQAEANRLRLAPDVLATKLLREQLAQAPAPLKALEALAQLRQIAKQMPFIDAVKLAQDSREDLEYRSVFTEKFSVSG
jgi:hypothetical protein